MDRVTNETARMQKDLNHMRSLKTGWSINNKNSIVPSLELIDYCSEFVVPIVKELGAIASIYAHPAETGSIIFQVNIDNKIAAYFSVGNRLKCAFARVEDDRLVSDKYDSLAWNSARFLDRVEDFVQDCLQEFGRM